MNYQNIDFMPYEKAYSQGYEDMQRRVPDISKVSKFIDWEPEMNLNSIIKDVADYLNSTKN